jgi:hypothetical protein
MNCVNCSDINDLQTALLDWSRLTKRKTSVFNDLRARTNVSDLTTLTVRGRRLDCVGMRFHALQRLSSTLSTLKASRRVK